MKIDERAGPVTHDLGTATVLPGLIDVHVHITYFSWPDLKSDPALASYRSEGILANARATLMAGFTTVQSLGSSGDKALREATAAGIVVGPRIVTSLRQIWGAKQTPEQLRALVRQTKSEGADVIKFMGSGVFLAGGKLNVTQEQLDAVCSEAKALGLRCVVHAHSGEAITAAVKAGCTGIEHGFLADDAAIDAMARAGVFFVPNIGLALQQTLENKEWPPTPENATKLAEAVPRLRAIFQKGLAAGLRMPVGTDAVAGGHGQNIREILVRVNAGQNPMEAITGATSLAAESLGMEKTIGTLGTGYEADIIAVAGNPLDDINALQNVTFVMKGGKLYKR